MINFNNRFSKIKSHFADRIKSFKKKRKKIINQFTTKFSEAKNEPKSKFDAFLDGFTTSVYILGLSNPRRVGSIIFIGTFPDLVFRRFDKTPSTEKMTNDEFIKSSSSKMLINRLINGTAALGGQSISSVSFIFGIVIGAIFAIKGSKFK